MANTHAAFHRNTVVGGRGGGGRNGPGICLVPSFGVQVLDPFNPGNYILSAGVSNVCNERAYNVTVEVVITMDCNGATVPVTHFVAPTYPYSVGANSFAQLYNAERVSGCSSNFYAPSFTEYYAGYYSATLADGTSDYASASTSRTYSNFRSHSPNGIATSSKKPKPERFPRVSLLGKVSGNQHSVSRWLGLVACTFSFLLGSWCVLNMDPSP